MPNPSLLEARLFFALVPGAGLRQELAELAISVADGAQGRPVALKQLHLTLLFLGNVARTRIDELRHLAAAIRQPPFDLRLTSVGRFRNAGVAWIAPHDEDAAAVLVLAHTLARRAEAAGFALERREFHPHVTLARRCSKAPILDRIPPLEWRIDRYALMESIPDGSGVAYRELEAWPLAA